MWVQIPSGLPNKIYFMDELSNWLAPQTVNLPPSGHVGSNPTSFTSPYLLIG